MSDTPAVDSVESAPQGQESAPIDDSQVPVEQQTPENAAPQEEPKTDGVQKRINQLTAEKYDLKRQLEQAQQAPPQAEPVAPGAPTLEQFDYDEDKFRSASIQHEVQKQMGVLQEQQVKQQQDDDQQRVMQSYNQKAADYAAKNPDFYESVSKLPLQNQGAQQAIMTADRGPEIAHYLTQHLDIADQLNGSDPYTAARIIGTIESQLSVKPQQTVSSAPDPVQPLSGGGELAKDLTDPSLSMEDFYNQSMSRE